MDFSKRNIRFYSKLDGLVFATDDWRLFNTNFGLKLYSGYQVSKLRPSSIQGLKILEGRKTCFKITLGQIQEMEVSIVCSLLGERDVDFSTILKVFKKAMSDTASSMVGTTTYYDWRAKVIETEKRLVVKNDVVMFGNRLLLKLKSRFRVQYNREGEFDCTTVAMAMGQNTDLCNLEDILSKFHLEAAQQLIFHYAVDFEHDGVLLAWNREKLLNHIGRPKQEYYAGMLKGHGNFYFDLEERDRGAGRFVEIKCYSELCKFAHRQHSELPFSSNRNAECLFSSVDVEGGFCVQRKYPWNKQKQNIQMVNRILEDLQSIQNSITARSEVIISVLDPSMESIKNVINRMETDTIVSSRSLLHCLSFIKIQDVREHTVLNIYPAIDTLAHYVDARIKCIEDRTANVFNPDDYITTSFCEAIVCFFLYGTALYRSGRRLFPGWVLDRTGLTKHCFARGAFRVEQIVSPLQLEIFTDNANTTRNRNTFYRYVGDRLDVSNLMQTVKLFPGLDDIVKDPFLELVNFVQDIETDNFMFLETSRFVKKAVQSIVKCICLSSGKSLGVIRRKGIKFSGYESLYGFKCDKNLREFITTMGFVNFLFETKCKGHSFLLWVISLYKWVFIGKPEMLDTFKKCIRDELENSLFRNISCLVFPFDDGFFKIVMPCAGTRDQRFSDFNIESKRKFCRLYIDCFNGYINLIDAAITRVLDDRVFLDLDTPFKNVIRRIKRRSHVD